MTSFERLGTDLRLFVVRIPPAHNSLGRLGHHFSTVSVIANRVAEVNRNADIEA